MNYSVNQIYQLFEGKLICKQSLKWKICQAVSLLPEKLIQTVTTKCWFISSLEDAWGFTIKGEEVQKEYLIYLSDDLINEPEVQIYFTVLHEIGHVVLNHRNSIVEHQSKEEILKQEKEADQFAQTYLLI